MKSKALQAIADKWVGAACTLNGEPAKVMGNRNDFATISTLDTSGPAFEWAWSTVDRIMSKEGKFKT